jgi:hypothetical protein
MHISPFVDHTWLHTSASWTAAQQPAGHISWTGSTTAKSFLNVQKVPQNDAAQNAHNKIKLTILNSYLLYNYQSAKNAESESHNLNKI